MSEITDRLLEAYQRYLNLGEEDDEDVLISYEDMATDPIYGPMFSGVLGGYMGALNPLSGYGGWGSQDPLSGAQTGSGGWQPPTGGGGAPSYTPVSQGGSVASKGDVGLYGAPEQRAPEYAPENINKGWDYTYTGPIVPKKQTSAEFPFQVFPVPGATFASSYGASREALRGPGAWHEGNDLMAPEGSPIVAPFRGRVEYDSGSETAGNALWLTNPHYGAIASFHNLPFSDDLPEEGSIVKPGGLIGYVGATGNASAPAYHSHMEYQPGGAHTQGVDPFGELTGVAEAQEALGTLLKQREREQSRTNLGRLRRRERGFGDY